MKSHDQNFKNLFLDFPEEALEWILPEALESCGKILKNVRLISVRRSRKDEVEIYEN